MRSLEGELNICVWTVTAGRRGREREVGMQE